ncbi:MAG: hypothetical protein OXI66_19340 [Boseongicola sp.]|nr:hypothetical protein [Boseongicola sp.]
MPTSLSLITASGFLIKAPLFVSVDGHVTRFNIEHLFSSCLERFSEQVARRGLPDTAVPLIVIPSNVGGVRYRHARIRGYGRRRQVSSRARQRRAAKTECL